MPSQIENEIKYILQDPEKLISKLDLMVSNKQCKYKVIKDDIHQGYLDSRARLRKSSDETVNCKYVFNYKYVLMDKLYEIETRIDEGVFNALWTETKNRLSKTRYSFYYDNLHWDIDFFLNDNNSIYFSMAEVEMPDNQEKPDKIPEFLEKYIIFQAPRLDEKYTSKNISNISYGTQLYCEITQNNEIKNKY